MPTDSALPSLPFVLMANTLYSLSYWLDFADVTGRLAFHIMPFGDALSTWPEALLYALLSCAVSRWEGRHADDAGTGQMG